MTTTVDRVVVKTAPSLVLRIQRPSAVRFWVTPWFNRESSNVPVYISWNKETCDAGSAPMLPMSSQTLKLLITEPTEIWMKAESDVIVNYAVDPIAHAGAI
jgi:hypothetical protein